ncbi:MAG: hypothetical protein AAB112_02455, partial [Thermodesulfobacteriota bacterium]
MVSFGSKPSRMARGGRTIAKRIIVPFAILLILLLASNLSARRARNHFVHSAILMNMTSGRVLYAHNADDPLPPASITKVLSLYLADEAIRDGKV